MKILLVENIIDLNQSPLSGPKNTAQFYIFKKNKHKISLGPIFLNMYPKRIVYLPDVKTYFDNFICEKGIFQQLGAIKMFEIIVKTYTMKFCLY
jgi:hypothetical protein